MSDISRRFTSFSNMHRPHALAGFVSFIKRLPPGDKFILSLLAGSFIITCFVGLVALERSYLVKVPAHGGALTEGVLGAPRFVNPLLALSDADRDLTALTYAGLMGIGEDGSLVPVLAESYTVSPDGKTYTFVLREHLKFSDGSPITADDVVYTIEQAQDPGLKSPEYANWANIQAAAVDARTITFTLPQPYTPFLEDTTLGILPARLWRNVANDQFPFAAYMERPVGAGPFQVVNVIRDKDGQIRQYDLEAFEDYATGRPYLDAIRLKFYSNHSDLAKAVADHKVESAYGVARAGALRAPYARVFGVFFNQVEEPLFKNQEVREALSLAIDRDAIVTTVLGGYGTPLAGPVPPGSGIEEPALPNTTTRIEDARAVLDEGGWDYDETKGWTAGKTVMPTIALKTSNVPELKAIAELVQKDWEALGVPVELELYEPGNLVQEVIRPRTYGALLFGEVVGRDRDLFAFWHSSQVSDPGLNIAAYEDDVVDSLLTRARSESDPVVAKASLQDAANRIARAYPAAFTHAPDFLYAVPKDLEGIVLPQITSPSDRFATVATWHRNSEYVWPFLVGSK